MKSETLRNIRTMRQVKSSLEIAANQKVKTTNSLGKAEQEIALLDSTGLDTNEAAQIMAREKARAAKFESSVERSQQKMLNSRKKIAGVVNRNRALTKLRHNIQHERDTKKYSTVTTVTMAQPETAKHGNLHGIELKY